MNDYNMDVIIDTKENSMLFGGMEIDLSFIKDPYFYDYIKPHLNDILTPYMFEIADFVTMNHIRNSISSNYFKWKEDKDEDFSYIIDEKEILDLFKF